jgi:hypothetical protein
MPCESPGGTANLAVPGGNVPPGRACELRSQLSAGSVRAADGRVVRQNGPMARSTRNSSAHPYQGRTFSMVGGSTAGTDFARREAALWCCRGMAEQNRAEPGVNGCLQM